MCQLLVAEFFPKWHNILHVWLTSEPNYEEIWQWFSWWKSQIAEEFNDTQALAAEWEKGLEMINQALDLGDRAKTELPPPIAGPVRPIQPAVPTTHLAGNGAGATLLTAQHQEASFKDVVDDWCVEQGLIMVPLREAHPQTGLPLFRITASVNGKGVYLYISRATCCGCRTRRTSSFGSLLV
jgi:tuftelin-interacting protein 11